VAPRLSEAGSARGWQRLLLIGPTATTEIVAANLPDAWKRLLIDPLDRNLINAPVAEWARWRAGISMIGNAGRN